MLSEAYREGRTAKLGDGWYPIGTNPAHPLESLQRYGAAVARLRKLTAEAGRDPASVALAYRCQKYGPDVPAIRAIKARTERPFGVNFQLVHERIDYWKSQGAELSITVQSLLKRARKAAK